MCLKLPLGLETMSAVRDGDSEACVAMVPFIRDGQVLAVVFGFVCVE